MITIIVIILLILLLIVIILLLLLLLLVIILLILLLLLIIIILILMLSPALHAVQPLARVAEPVRGVRVEQVLSIIRVLLKQSQMGLGE